MRCRLRPGVQMFQNAGALIPAVNVVANKDCMTLLAGLWMSIDFLDQPFQEIGTSVYIADNPNHAVWCDGIKRDLGMRALSHKAREKIIETFHREKQ